MSLDKNEGPKGESIFTPTLSQPHHGFSPAYIVLPLVIAVPILVFWLGAENLNHRDTEPQIAPLEVVNSEGNIDASNFRSQFPSHYSGETIKGPIVELRREDYKSSSASNPNNRFWATPYFTVGGKLYYSKDSTSSTSRELAAVDYPTFKLFEGSIYARDKIGIICYDRWAHHIDPTSFEVIKRIVGDPGSIYSRARESYYAKDKRAVYVDCKQLLDADPGSFEELASVRYQDGEVWKTAYYGIDASAVYLNEDKIEKADPNTFVVLEEGYSLDKSGVFYLDQAVGSSVVTSPEGFAGEINFIAEVDDKDKAYLLFKSESGQIDILYNQQINNKWSFSGSNLLEHKGQIYFLADDMKLKRLNVASGTISQLNINLEQPENNRKPELVSMFAYADTLYYLKGLNCNEYMARCNLSLYSYDLINDSESLLATGVTPRKFEGLDESTRTLYLGYGDGDAGCWLARYEAYSFADKRIRPAGECAGCQESDAKCKTEEAKKVREKDIVLKGSFLKNKVVIERLEEDEE